MSDLCEGILTNPDTSGIGASPSPARACATSPDVPDSFSRLGPWSTALTQGVNKIVTVIVQIAQSVLDLYHAIFVMHPIAFLGVVYANNLRRFVLLDERSFRMSVMLLIQMASAAMFIDRSATSSSALSVRAVVTWLRVPSFVGLGGAVSGLPYQIGMVVGSARRESTQAADPEKRPGEDEYEEQAQIAGGDEDRPQADADLFVGLLCGV
ncbi:hypothetical protein BC834DRAFT_974315 [Gloeopeniophorella convolvens]|nr:hypothetical protein BC834DRAFT_974315 [Gloeopeniophorella convolvens]